MSIKVLVVDDNKLNVRLLTDILEDEGYVVYSADNGLPVLSMTHELKPDIILLDIMMPGLDGYEVCKQIRSEYELRNIPIIMISAKTKGADIMKALELGAFDYIKKPIDEEETIARIQSALRYKKERERLEELAMKDGLTGLYNHALLMELFDKEFNKHERDYTPISFVMIDIDFFKNVNDTYGHLAGDKVLKDISTILLNSTREGDIVGRYGGEEFGLVLRGISEKEVYQICQRIRTNIGEYKFFISKDEYINITVSIGICIETGEVNLTPLEMGGKSDEALYEAKNAGRNRVKIYGEK